MCYSIFTGIAKSIIAKTWLLVNEVIRNGEESCKAKDNKSLKGIIIIKNRKPGVEHQFNSLYLYSITCLMSKIAYFINFLRDLTMWCSPN